MLSTVLSRLWWVVLLRGALAILFGILALGYPRMTLGSLVLYFAALAIVDGLSSLFQAFSGRAETENWWVLLVEGLLGVAFGVIAFQAPAITALLLLLYIGFWAIATGALRIILAIRLRNEIEGEWWMVLAGLASILFGVAMIARPLAGALALLTVIGVWSLVSGVFLVLAAIRLKSVAGKAGTAKDRLAAKPA